MRHNVKKKKTTKKKKKLWTCAPSENSDKPAAH